MNNFNFRPAQSSEISQIWEILQQAIQRRKEDGSNQWQDGYPNPDVIRKDLEKNAGYVLTLYDAIVGYAAIMINDEPEYANIVGKWLTEGDFVVFHRVALSEKHLGQGLAQRMILSIEDFARANKIFSVKADTNFDNPAMMRIFEKLGYAYCGEVHFRGSPRRAYEKVLK
jgi:GNAT superfamily N-acetyltransferase